MNETEWPVPRSIYPYQDLTPGEIDVLYDHGDDGMKGRAFIEMRRRWRDIPSFRELMKMIAPDIIKKYNLQDVQSWEEEIGRYQA